MQIATGSDDKTVQIWDASTGKDIFTYHGHSGVVAGVIWSPNGRFIASSAEDGTLKVWWSI
jgi:eukaryotic-like serine/threonine-protein kinase